MKKHIEQAIALVLIILLCPLFVVIAFLIFFSSGHPILFSQKRTGKDKQPFVIYKFRTMVENAETLKTKIENQNEADGPVFKIRNDPRYTKIGKWLAGRGIDELPQLFNILKGEMAFVGPRPLPIDEAKKVPKKYEKRFSVLPGITSPWVIAGTHQLTFDEWMKSDIEYVNKKSIVCNISIAFKTIIMIFRSFFH